MGKNVMATVLRVIGCVAAVGCVISGIILGEEVDEIIGIAVVVSGFVNCALFYGFAEIITLLQKSVDVQESMLKWGGRDDIAQGKAPVGVLQDIEANLPEM